jgi:nucleoside-diphosphate-sugar epimerase
LEFARKKNVANTVFASTREVYGSVPDVTRIKETDAGITDQIDPRNCYPESKRLAEAIFVAYASQYGVSYTILRIAHTYGPGMTLENDGRVMADFIAAAVAGRPIRLNSDGSAMRSFCYVSDAVDGIVRAILTDDENGVYNLSNETEPYPIRETASILAEMFADRGVSVSYADPNDSAYKGGYNKTPLVQMDTSRMEELGWTPKVQLKEGMRRTVESFKGKKNGYIN